MYNDGVVKLTFECGMTFNEVNESLDDSVRRVLGYARNLCQNTLDEIDKELKR
jgi:hypothetical protein